MLKTTSLREVPRSFFAALRLLTMVGATIASQQIVIDLVTPYALGRRRLRLRLGKATSNISLNILCFILYNLYTFFAINNVLTLLRAYLSLAKINCS